WVGDNAPESGDALIFPASALQKVNINDFVGYSFAKITFTGGGYNISGNAIGLDVGIVNSGTSFNQFGLDVTLDCPQTWTNTGVQFTDYGNIFLDGITLKVNTNATSPITLAGGISGTGGVTKIGTGSLTFLGTVDNDYTGTTAVNAGKLYLGKHDGFIAVPGPLTTSTSAP